MDTEDGKRVVDAVANDAAAPEASVFERVVTSAKRQLLALTGRPFEGVVGLERLHDGWRITIDVLELARVPDTTDILATYHVDLDEAGALRGYERVRRFVRGRPDADTESPAHDVGP